MGNTISQCLSNSAALDTSFSCSQLSLQGCSSTDKPLSWSVSSLLWQQTEAWFKITSPVTFNCLTIKNGADRTCGLLLNKRCQETFSTSLSFQQHLTLCLLRVSEFLHWSLVLFLFIHFCWAQFCFMFCLLEHKSFTHLGQITCFLFLLFLNGCKGQQDPRARQTKDQPTLALMSLLGTLPSTWVQRCV